MIILREKRLNEFLEKDIERAIELIKKQIEKRLNIKLVQLTTLGKFRKARTGEVYGQKFKFDNNVLRLNWSSKKGNKIVSIDFFDNLKSNMPKYTLNVIGLNIIQIFDELEKVLKGNFSSDYIEKPEPEELIITDIDNEFKGLTKEEDVFNAIVLKLLRIADEKGIDKVYEFYKNISYQKSRTFDFEEFKRVNIEKFINYVFKTKTFKISNPNVKRLNDLILEKNILNIKNIIDKFEVREYTLTKIIDFKDLSIKHFNYLSNYLSSKYDKKISSSKTIMEFLPYINSKLNKELLYSNIIDKSLLEKELNIIFDKDNTLSDNLDTLKKYMDYFSEINIKKYDDKYIKNLLKNRASNYDNIYNQYKKDFEYLFKHFKLVTDSNELVNSFRNHIVSMFNNINITDKKYMDDKVKHFKYTFNKEDNYVYNNIKTIYSLVTPILNKGYKEDDISYFLGSLNINDIDLLKFLDLLGNILVISRGENKDKFIKNVLEVYKKMKI